MFNENNSLQREMFFEYIQECFELPDILIKILDLSGYNNLIAIKGLNEDAVKYIERYVAENSTNDSFINSVYANVNKDNFCLLPGHRTVLLSLSSYAEKYDECRTERFDFIKTFPFSFIMKQLIKTALNNHERDQKHQQFPIEIQNWATYLYTMCGKACYEVLSSNLPLPQPNTICKCCV